MIRLGEGDKVCWPDNGRESRVDRFFAGFQGKRFIGKRVRKRERVNIVTVILQFKKKTKKSSPV